MRRDGRLMKRGRQEGWRQTGGGVEGRWVGQGERVEHNDAQGSEMKTHKWLKKKNAPAIT